MHRSWIIVAIAGGLLWAAGGCPEEEPDPGDDDTTPGPMDVLTLVEPAYACTELALEAVALAPTWLQGDLRATLMQLDADEQDELAALLIDLPDPRGRDELAFTLAHTPPEVFARDDVYPQLWVENVETLHAIDEVIQYAEIVDHGDPLEGGDYYSTLRYRTEQSGQLEEIELDREIYYWYVVHPDIEDEVPTYIHPVNGWPTDPEDGGRFWREYLFYDSDPGYEPLLTYVENETVLWKGKAYEKDDNGAIGQIIHYILDVLDFTSDNERPNQPVRIYAKHIGRCGEHQDLATAAARAALIPCINVSAWANDHVWNEFYDDRWVQWEPVNTYVEHYYYYADENGDFYWSYNRIDNDCDGEVDEDAPAEPDTSDGDGDGVSCAEGDCHDQDAAILPGAPELPNGIDDDCDGTVDEDVGGLDLDGDGVTVDGGDCDDTRAEVYPGNTEVPADGVDNDCDLQADDGLDTADADLDLATIADGDCNDTDPAVAPGLLDVPDGIDNDCDGEVDEDLALSDVDGDGFMVGSGDCNDAAAGIHPNQQDGIPSSNRNFAVQATRGDGKTWTVTERYAGAFTLEVNVTDAEGTPMPGAAVMIAGYSSTYGPGDPGLTWVTWTPTDETGQAVFQLGEANEYHGRVETSIGTIPSMQTVRYLFDDPVKGETRVWDVELHETWPGREVSAAPADGGAWSLQLDASFEDGMIGAFSPFYEQTCRDPGPGGLDWMVVDAGGLAALQAGEPVDAVAAELGVTVASGEVALPDDGPWYLVAAAPLTHGTIVDGTLTVQAMYEGTVVDELDAALTVLQGDWAAVEFSAP